MSVGLDRVSAGVLGDFGPSRSTAGDRADGDGISQPPGVLLLSLRHLRSAAVGRRIRDQSTQAVTAVQVKHRPRQYVSGDLHLGYHDLQRCPLALGTRREHAAAEVKNTMPEKAGRRGPKAKPTRPRALPVGSPELR